MKYINEKEYVKHTGKAKIFKINISEEEKFLNIVAKKLTRDISLPIIEDNLKNIFKRKTITLDNMQELFTYLQDAEYSNTHYFDTVKDLILNADMDAAEAIILTEEIKKENDYMMSVMCNHILNIDNGEVA